MHSTTIIRGKIFSHFNYTNVSSFLLSLSIRRLSCWKCGIQHENGLHCFACKSLQEPSKINYFELMNVDVSYDVDTKALVPRYHSLQILYHPDKQFGETEENRKKSVIFSTLVNKAYSTLTDPVERALYILKLNGITLDEITSIQNPELLMMILEFNDDISKVKCVEDAQKIKQNVDKRIEKLSRLASEYFKKEDFKTAKEFVIQMKYYANVLKSLKAKIREKGLDM